MSTEADSPDSPDSPIYDPLEEYAGGKSHPLIEASKSGDHSKLLDLVVECKKKDKPLRVCDIRGWQAIHHVAKLTDTRCLCLLLQYDASLVHSLTHEHTTPLMVAADLGNVEAARTLLEFLSEEDITDVDLHGNNALYYAIACNTEQATTLALLLLTFNRRQYHFQCGTVSDAIPFRTILNKNRKVLESMLSAGLDFNYNCVGLHVKYMCINCNIDRYADMSVPTTLMGYCVAIKWAEGLQLLISSYKKQAVNRKPEDVRSGLRFHFCKSHIDLPGYGSAWNIAFVAGSIQCLDLMLAEGMTLTSRVGMFFPMTLALSDDIWSKQEFIKYFLSLLSCSEFDQIYKKYVEEFSIIPKLPTALATRQEANMLCTTISSHRHPFDVVIDRILRDSNKRAHSIDESIKMLLECGFSFDFRHILTCGFTLDWQNSISKLLELGHNWTTCILEYIEPFVKHLSNIPINYQAVAASCKTITSIHSTEFPHFIILRLLSQRSKEEVSAVYGSLCVIGGTLVNIQDGNQLYSLSCYRSGEDRGILPLFFPEPSNPPWFGVAHLLLKGIRALFNSAFYSKCERNNNILPFSVLLLTDQERKLFFECSTLVDDPLYKMYKECEVSSLQSLCRPVIRNQIGFDQLLKEPVPRNPNDTSCAVVRDMRWEISAIDQLCIPSSLKHFLRYTPEMIQYSEYYNKVGRDF